LNGVRKMMKKTKMVIIPEGVDCTIGWFDSVQFGSVRCVALTMDGIFWRF
jgi:hypothetical protein